MRIAILGWGSLLWEGGPEFDRWHGPWQYDGPTMKIEFSRVSASRLRALTLVVDNEHGIPTEVAWCVSKRTNPEDAICDLRAREGTVIEKIGRSAVSPPSNASIQETPENPFMAWARAKNFEFVIWTALTSNFATEVGRPFTVAEAVSHVKGLTPEGKVKAAEYIWRAPGFVKTPVRSALQKEPWFSDSDN